MDYIRKMPLLISLTAALAVGITGRVNRVPDKENMVRMLIVMVIFYIVGFLAKDTLLNLLETAAKKEEEKKKDLASQEKENRKESENKKETPEGKGKRIDLKANDDSNMNTNDEEFDALPVAEFIKKELNQS